MALLGKMNKRGAHKEKDFKGSRSGQARKGGNSTEMSGGGGGGERDGEEPERSKR